MEVVGTFEGRLDPELGVVGLRLPDGTHAPAALVTVGEGAGGVAVSTANIVRAGTGCGGSSFEADVTLTNGTGTALANVYAEIVAISKTGAEGCEPSANPRPGSSDVSTVNGLWAYGNLAAGASRTVHWKFSNPTATPYTFTGRVLAAGSLAASGAGSSWGTTIDDVILDSDATALYATVKFRTPPASDGLVLLVDDLNRTSGMGGAGALTFDPTGSWGSLSFPASYTVGNGAGADFDYFQLGTFAADGTLTPAFHKTITGAAASSDATGTAMTQDAASGRYHFRIPYAAFGGAAGDAVQVYALFGQSNQFGLGIHSAAPAPSAPQVALMDGGAARGLSDLDTAPASHVLAAPTCVHPLVISAVYGGGGAASGNTYSQDFIELHNRSARPFTIPAGWSVQYGSATGNFAGAASNSHVLPPVTIPAGGFYLLGESAGPGGAAIPAPDATGTLAVSATSFKVVLLNHSTVNLACASLTGVEDLVSFGTGNCPEGTAAPGLSMTSGAVRNGDGCFDTGSNLADFTVSTPPAVPRNSASPPVLCPTVCQ